MILLYCLLLKHARAYRISEQTTQTSKTPGRTGLARSHLGQPCQISMAYVSFLLSSSQMKNSITHTTPTRTALVTTHDTATRPNRMTSVLSVISCPPQVHSDFSQVTGSMDLTDQTTEAMVKARIEVEKRMVSHPKNGGPSGSEEQRCRHLSLKPQWPQVSNTECDFHLAIIPPDWQ